MADEYRMLIAGEWTGSQSGATFEATSPSTGEVIGMLPEGTREDVRRAVAAAAGAFRTWSGLTAFDRARAMRRVAEAIDGRRDEMARTLALDQGKPMRAEAFDEVEELIAYFEMAAADAVRVEGLIPPSVTEGNRVFV
jgi:acyl-CoA reductase-like NAD-dependent aldehyde dehydrogenase